MSNIQDFDFSVNLLKVILWQYNEDENLLALLEKKQAWYKKNQSEFWTNWYTDVFNLETANNFGLSVWSIILDVSINSELPPSDLDAPAFGFGEYYENFNNGNFISQSSTSINLSLSQKRLVLQLRYYQLISNGTVPDINRFLKRMFGDAYVLDTYNMGYVTFVFKEEVSEEFQYVLENFDLLPIPAGVGKKIIYDRADIFGFGENYQNFNNGVFANF